MRQSNFELLRIVCMMLVLTVHADFWSLGVPSWAQISATPVPALTRMLVESAALVCVNVFVMISGWFGIRPSLRGLAAFLFQCLFYSGGIYLAMILLGKAQFDLAGVVDNALLLGRNWFVGSYLVLYLVSPLLNRLIRGASSVTLAVIVAAFYLVQTCFGWIADGAIFDGGYSSLSFVGLYLLAALLRRRSSALRPLSWLYPVSVVANVALMALIARTGVSLSAEAYSNPLVIMASVGLFSAFARLKIDRSNFINTLASSAFAVYLIHMNPYIAPSFRAACIRLYDAVSGPLCLLSFALGLVAIYAVCVAADRIRIVVWRLIVSRIGLMPQQPAANSVDQ